MYQLLLFFQVIIAMCIVGLVLIQQGKGATTGAAFGGGASQTVFGSRGSGSFLFRLTIGLGFAFFAMNIILNHVVTAAVKQERVISSPLPTKPAPTQTDTKHPTPSNKP